MLTQSAVVPNSAIAQRWFLGTPDPSQPNLIHFRTPVPEDFVTKVMQQQQSTAPLGKSYKRTVHGAEYSILEQQIAWDPNFSLDSVTFVVSSPKGGETKVSGTEYAILNASRQFR